MTRTQPSHRQFEALCDASPDGIVLVDEEGRITYANETVTDLFGYEREALHDEPIELLVPEDIEADHVDKRESYMADPTPRPMGAGLDLAGQRKDGSTFPVSVSLSVIDISGETHFMAAIRDITDRTVLRSKYRALLDSAPDAIVVADAQTGEIVEANKKAAELVGRSVDELVGAEQTVLHPSGEEERYRSFFEYHLDAGDILSEFPDGSQVYVERSDGSRVPVGINIATFELDDRKLVTGAFRDISDRRTRERELERAETIIQASGDAVYMLDPDAHIEFVNNAFERLTGYEESALVGEHVSKIMAEPDVETGEELIRSLLETDRDRGTFEMTIHPAEGEPIPTENHVAVLESDDGRLEASVGVIRDISDRKERVRELERQNKRLDEFASVVSHDLRNPLSVASGHLQLARDDCDSEHIDAVQSAHDRMDRIIEQTLTLARKGEDVGDTAAVDLEQIAGSCWDRVETADADLHVRSLPTVVADRTRLSHIFENLFRNAIEHGGTDVTVTVGGLENGFYVEDSGPGIPPSARESIFDAGYAAAEGAGLGLAIVNRIVEAHGWTVTVTEGNAGGARFEIRDVETVPE